MGIERRRHPRYEILAQVKVPHGDTTFVLDVGNISESGVYLTYPGKRAPAWLKQNRELTMSLFVPELVENLPLTGIIVHVRGAEDGVIGFGVRFDALPTRSREELDRLIALAESPDRPPPLRRGRAG